MAALTGLGGLSHINKHVVSATKVVLVRLEEGGRVFYISDRGAP